MYRIREENNSRRTPTLRSYRIVRTMPPLRQRREHKTPAHRYTRRYSPVLSSLYLALRLRVIKNDRPQASLKLSRLKARLLLSLSLSLCRYSNRIYASPRMISRGSSASDKNLPLSSEKFCGRVVRRCEMQVMGDSIGNL